MTQDPLFGGLFLFLSVISYMANFGDQILGVSFQVAGSAIDPGSGQSIYITSIHNGTDAVIAAGVTLSSSSNIILGKNASLTFNPPMKCARGETATPGTGVTVTYFIAK